jgi:hypothetical protein
LKAAKAAKTANVFVTLVTELTIVTHVVSAILVPTLGWWTTARTADRRVGTCS